MPLLLSNGWPFYLDTSFSTDGIMVLTHPSHGCMHSKTFYFVIYHFIHFFFFFWKRILKNLYKIAKNLLNKGVGGFMGACVIGLGWASSIPSTCRVLSPMGDIPNIRQTFLGFRSNRLKLPHKNYSLLVYPSLIYQNCPMKSMSQLAWGQPRLDTMFLAQTRRIPEKDIAINMVSVAYCVMPCTT